MGDKQLKRIVLSDFGTCYNVEGHYGKGNKVSLELNTDTPKDINYLKDYLAGLLLDKDRDSSYDIIDNMENSNEHPLEEDIFQKVKSYLHSWSEL